MEMNETMWKEIINFPNPLAALANKVLKWKTLILKNM